MRLHLFKQIRDSPADKAPSSNDTVKLYILMCSADKSEQLVDGLDLTQPFPLSDRWIKEWILIIEQLLFSHYLFNNNSGHVEAKLTEIFSARFAKIFSKCYCCWWGHGYEARWGPHLQARGREVAQVQVQAHLRAPKVQIIGALWAGENGRLWENNLNKLNNG